MEMNAAAMPVNSTSASVTAVPDPSTRMNELEKALEDRNRRVAELHMALLRMEVKLAFYNSRFLRERTLLSPELAFKAYGDRFQVRENEEPRVVAMVDGAPMQSQRQPGRVADVDEALALFMDSDPDMQPLLRSTPGGAGTAGTGQAMRVIAATDSAGFSRNLDDIAAGRVLVR